jgi:serine/threonine protein kinase
MTTLDGRYELGERLGGGATADVFRAHDTRLGRDVAVKVFHRTGALPDQRGRLESEVRLLASLTHPNLVALYDAEIGDEPYVVMELVEGASLASQMPLAPDRAAQLGAEVAAGLGYVHARGIVHRDVKPANVLLMPDGRAKVADFGIARLVDDAGMTQAGLVVGTAAYLAPEQVRGQTVTTAADVYSLGLVLLEALTGHREYDGAPTDAAGARLHRSPTIPTSLGNGWTSLLAAMTASDPIQRPDMAAVERRLRAMQLGTTGATQAMSTQAMATPAMATPAMATPAAATQVLRPTAASVPTTVAPAEPEARRGWIVALTVLLLVIAGGAVAIVVALRHTSAQTPATAPSSSSSPPASVTSTPPTTASSTPPTTPTTTPTTSSSPSSSSSSSPPPTTSSSAAPTTSSASPTPTATTPSSSSPSVATSGPSAAAATTTSTP